MSEISFPNKHNYLWDRDTIEFCAIVDGKTVPCRITLEEILREYGRGSPATFENDFLELRPQIEERARKEIVAKLDH